MLADVIIFVYEVPCIFWHYINVDKVSLITLKKVLQSAMELLQIATTYFITKCDGQLSQIATAFLLQSATRYITNCDVYYKVRWIYYKLRQVLQSAMIITDCDSTEPDLNLHITFKSPRVHKFLSRGFSVVSVSQQLYPGGPEIKIGMLMLVG